MAAQDKGFFEALFDLSFSSFVTTKLIKVIYILIIALSAVMAVGVLGGGIRGGVVGIVVALLMAPTLFVLAVLSGRVWLELIIVMFRIAENVNQIAEQQGGGDSDA